MKDIDTKVLMSEAKFYEGYSRWDDSLDRYETWEESVSRVMNMHRGFYADKMNEELGLLIDEAEALYKLRYVLGAQRALQFGGEQILKHHLRMFNCLSSYADRPAYFGEFFYALLCGAGVGFSIQTHHVAKLPKIAQRKGQAKVHIIDDSIEGWATALDVLMSSYFETGGKHPEFKGRKIYFDLQKIRPRGSMISGGFKAPGPEPLRKSLDKIEHLLQGIILSDNNVLRPIHVYDICMHAADAVLAGGVRRSATICLFSPDDNDMIAAKTGDWFSKNPQRGRSNNSAVIVRNTANREQFASMMKSIRQFGEPGFVFVESTEHTYNPCVEIGKYPVWIDEDNNKHSGFQGCVSYDTHLITKDGIETIGDVVDNNKTIDIWNGKNWSSVTPIQTGSNRELYRVSFSDGSYLDCTENHKFITKCNPWDEYSEYELKDIDVVNKTWSIPRPNITSTAGMNNSDAYTLGVEAATTATLPIDIFAWNSNSVIKFVEGWTDITTCIFGNEDTIRTCQLLLTKAGIVSKICISGSVYYLSISIDVMLTIATIEKLNGLHNSYCFEESELHQGVFNNVLTKQCNLTEINGSKCTTKEEFFKACRVGAIIGTLQAGYTDFKFLDPISKKIFDREALIGVSVTGWMNSPNILFDEGTLREGARIVKRINKQVAKLIHINPAARTTCVKPSGNASVLLGTSSGIHGDHSPRYLRNVQMNKDQEVAQLIKESNPYMVEDSKWSTNNTDYIISFPVIANEGSIFKRDLYGIKLLEKVKLVQQSWVEEGTDVDLCVDPTVRHNVSNTVQVGSGQWNEVEEYLFDNRNSFAGISFLAATGDKDFIQAPFTEVLTDDQLVEKYGRAAFFASGLIVESSKGFQDLWSATTQAQVEDDVRGEQYDMGMDWIRRFRNFADNYFDGDRKIAEYCLKDVYLLHKWAKIQQNMTHIDFRTGLQKKNYIDIDTMGAQACAGGTCEI